GKRQALRFERVRGFGKIMGDTRKFVRENFVVFFKTILFIVGPFALLTCTLQTFYLLNLFHPDDSMRFNKFGSYIAESTIFTQLRWAINGFITAMVVSHFVKVYREKGAGNFEVGDVSRSLLRDFGGSLLAFIIMFFSVALISTVLGVIILGMAEVSPETGILLFLAGWLGYILLRFPFWYFVFSVFIARTSQKKNMNVFAGMGLAGKVFSGNWWSTWVIFFLMWLILYLIGTAVAMPAQIIGMIAQMASYNINEQDTNWKLIETILVSLGEVMKTLIDAVCMITVALQFYNLKEKTDGAGTAELVNTIGAKEDDESLEYTY
ncbi:MAG TPA: hypothetical protein VL651_01930, partial [Bacteroidia bacterium]|nr:hypothetical protein [Bacteroidia bacterium]